MAVEQLRKPNLGTVAAVSEPIGVDDVPDAPWVAPKKLPAKLRAAKVVAEKERASDHPGSVRFRIRAVSGLYPAAYLVAPAGDRAEAEAVAEYLRFSNATAAQAGKLAVVQLPD